MNYITPEEILTYLPKEVRESESKADLISYIIRGYRRLKLPQDKDYREISETMGISEVNARVKMNRIKTKLKTILNP